MNVHLNVPTTSPVFGTKPVGSSLVRRVVRLLILFVALIVVLPLSAVSYAVGAGPICHARALAEARRRLGSLDLSSFQHAPIATAENAELLFIQAGNAVSLDEVTSRLLVDLLRRDDAKEIVRNRRHLAETLQQNRSAILLASSARRLHGCDAGIDYRQAEPNIPSFLGQVQLSRLLFVQGLLALDAGDVPTVLEAIDTLGRQAACLEQEPLPFLMLVGSSFERRQLRLIAHVVHDRRCRQDEAARIPHLLVSVDLRRAYRAYLRRKSAEIEAHYVQATSMHRDWSERFAQHLIEDHAFGGGLRCFVRELEEFDMPFARVREEFGPPRWRWQQLHWMLCSTGWDMGSVLRTNTDGRELASLAVSLRLAMLAGKGCGAAWHEIQVSAERAAGSAFLPRLRGSRDGSCKLIHPEAAAYKADLEDDGHPILIWPLDGPPAIGR